jgi:predicted permease
LDLAGSRLPEEEWNRVREELEERLRGEPGVRMVTSAGRLPLSLGNSYQSFRIQEVDPQPGQEGPRLTYTEVSPGYFAAMSIPILAGREFSAEDRAGGPGAVVVSRAFADRFWPGQDPLGREVFRGTNEKPWTVVGIAGDVKLHSMGEAPQPFLYFPMDQSPPHNLQLLIRGALPQAELAAILRRVIREVNPSLLVMEVKTMDQHLELPLFGPRAAGALLGTFGFLALLLSSMGLYGVVSFSVARRVREMGIRLSLGADAGQVVRMVVGRVLGVVALGGVAGLAAAVVLARLVRFFLVGISPADPLTLVAIPLVLGSVALMAALIPARRASRVNPVEALRAE